MAAHGATAAAQNSVAERRLRQIYDWLDNGNNKKALQEAEKVLKKQPDFQCCKVLKSLALLRLGRENEAQPVLDSVLNEGSTDDILDRTLFITGQFGYSRWLCVIRPYEYDRVP